MLRHVRSDLRLHTDLAKRREALVPFGAMALGLWRDQAIVHGKYVLKVRLGEGGMSEVWRAENTKTRQTVALKFLKGSSGTAPRGRERLLREAMLAVRHPHVVYIHDIEDLNRDVQFLVMEDLRGRTLRAELRRRGALGFERAMNVLLQLTSAVGAIHAKGVVHRDIKPDNILLMHNGAPGDFAKLIDFGIAKSLHRPASVACTDTPGMNGPSGTPGYMPPEQVRSAKDVGVEADMWSLGIVLWECLSGQHPWLRRTAVGVEIDQGARERLESDPASVLHRVFPDLPARVRDAMCGALHSDPARRIRVDALFSALAAHATVGVPPIPGPLPPRPCDDGMNVVVEIETQAPSFPQADLTTRTHPGSLPEPQHGGAAERGLAREPLRSAKDGINPPRPLYRSSRAQALFAAAGVLAVTVGLEATLRRSSEELQERSTAEVASVAPTPPTVLLAGALLSDSSARPITPRTASAPLSSRRATPALAASGGATSKEARPTTSERDAADGTSQATDVPPPAPPEAANTVQGGRSDSEGGAEEDEQRPPGAIDIFQKGGPPF